VCRTIVKTVLGDEVEQEIARILLSNDTIRRRIEDTSSDIVENVSNKHIIKIIFIMCKVQKEK
jgi:hypothetical protein